MRIPLPLTRRPRIEMVPLIDTFFLLLAFFMSSVLTLEAVRGLPVELPKAGGTVAFPGERLLITVTQDGTVQLEGESVTIPSLRDRLVAYPQREDLRVGIRADRQAPYHRIVDVLAAMKEAQVSRVSLLTLKETGPE